MMIKSLKNPTPDELDVIVAIWLQGNLQAHDFVPANYWHQHQSAVRSAIAEADLTVATVNDQIVGFAGLIDSEIAGLFVQAAAQNQGVGHALMAALKGKHPQLSLHVYQNNRKARRFYRREGFVASAWTRDPDTGAMDVTMVWQG